MGADASAGRLASLSFKKASEGLSAQEEQEFQQLSKQYSPSTNGATSDSGSDAISRRLASKG